MLAACSDSSSSMISLWSINRLEAGIGDGAPLAEAFLSAPVSSGAVEVQNGAVIIALGLHSRVPCLEILSVHDDRGHPIFVRMFRLEGSSYVRTLRGDWGCCICMAIKGRIVATVFPWKIEIYQFEENDARATFLQKIEFNRQVSYADIAFSPLTAFHNKAIENDKNQDVLSVVTAEDEGISVYTMSCSPDGQFELHLVWKHTPETRRDSSRRL
ncbi:hypothetical protein A0H81_09142 [Grifola frondosa]|uniref:Uncharacterized protein n=1 Tax=Grifola frondosa TaxID=5627 RepID=A0A1C7M0Z6_GRIFR|nr:hypothetical protein A0H81_09142 [Grifola frondosa]